MSERLTWSDRLNRALFPVLGPAQLGPGPQGERPVEHRAAMCPVCGASMVGHRVVRSTDGHTATRLLCP